MLMEKENCECFLTQGMIKEKREIQRSRGQVKMNLNDLLASQHFDSKLLFLRLYRDTLRQVVLFREKNTISPWSSSHVLSNR